MKLFIQRYGLHSYQVHKDDTDHLLYTASVTGGGLGQRHTLTMLDSAGNIILTAKPVYSGSLWEWSPKNYHITILGDVQHHFDLKCVNYWKQHWKMAGAQDDYDHHDHGWHLRSVFKNGKQIAAADQVTDFFKEKSIVYLDSTEDPLVVVGLILTMDMRLPRDKGKRSATGSIKGIFARQYDTTWRPK